MSFSVFLGNLVGLSLVFGFTTYLYTGSWKTTIIQTAICAVLLQVGYFASVLFLLYRSSAAKGNEASDSGATQDVAKDEKPAAEVRQLSGTPHSRHP